MKLNDLTDLGFKLIAEWHLHEDGLVSLVGRVPAEVGIYLFVVDARVRYVGSAADGLGHRMRSYSRRQNSNPAGRPVHEGLSSALKAGENVQVFTLAVPAEARTAWGKLPVSALLGIEAALIEDLHPLWNRRGRKLVLETDEVPGDP